MRVLFAGSPEISVPSLDAVSRTHSVVGVLTNPDRAAGRGRKVLETPVKSRASELGLTIIQPAKLDAETLTVVKRLEPEILVTVAYGRIFRESFLNLFSRGCINLHPSLLPRYRGPSPIPAAILAGDAVTGITVQEMALEMDAGDILLQKEIPLTGKETTGSLTELAARMGAEMIIQVLKDIEQGTIRSRPQSEVNATYCRLVEKGDGLISWARDAAGIERMIRAYTPWPGTYTTFKGVSLKILEARVSLLCTESTDRPGYVRGVDKSEGILIQTQKGCLAVSRLQLQAKKPLFWKDFVNGNSDIVGSVLGQAE